MKKLLLCLAAVLAAACGPRAAELRIPFEKHQLPNGLRVILSRDAAAPVVAVYLLYGVGARSEVKGRSGFAHLFEHMMFQGSENAPKGVHFRTIESNGGWLNGSTHPDFTDYFQVLPSNKLPVALWLEADRMRGLAITPENLANQKEAVKEERRLRLDNQPYAAAIVEAWPALAFRNWSNAHSLIGSFEDLDAATVKDVADFFRTHYAPNNSILALVGDIDIAAARKQVETYFGDIPAQPRPKPPDLAEPPPGGERRLTHKDAHAQVPAVIVGYPGPVRRSPDFYALVMLDVILTGGDSSRFQQNLVKGKKSVVQVEANVGWPFAGPSDYLDPGVYAIFAVHNPAVGGPEVVNQVQEEIGRVAREGVIAAELDRARTFLRSAVIRNLATTINRATLLAQYEYLDGNPDYVNTELDALLKVTGAQVRDAAAKQLTQDRRAVIEIVPSSGQEEKSR